MTPDTGDRLLDHYHCTFLLPLFDLEESRFEPRGELRHRYRTEAQADLPAAEIQGWHYFTPALRDILYDRGGETFGDGPLQPVQEWRLPAGTIEGWTLELGKKKESGQIARIEAVTLYRYFNGIYLLAWRVSPAALHALREEQARLRDRYLEEVLTEQRVERELFETPPAELTPTRRSLRETIEEEVERRLEREGVALFRSRAPATPQEALAAVPESHQEHYRALRIENWLHFTRLARILFPSFPEQNHENKISPLRLKDRRGGQLESAFEHWQPVHPPATPGESLSPVVKYLLALFATDPSRLEHYWRNTRAIYDDRLFVSVAYGLAGEELDQTALRRLYSLAFHVDRHADTFSRLDGHAYTPAELYPRLDEQTLWLWKGLGGHYGYTDAANIYLGSGGFFRNIIAPGHIPFIYDRMLIQALFYQATLRRYDARLAEDTPQLLESKSVEEIRKRRAEFIRFTNCYWFHQLTEQMQGKEIFRLQQQALGLATQYRIIRDKLGRTDEFLHMLDTDRKARESHRLTLWGGIFAVVAWWYALFGLAREWWNDSGRDDTLWEIFHCWPPGPLPENGWGLIAGGLLIPAALGILWFCWVSRRNIHAALRKMWKKIRRLP